MRLLHTSDWHIGRQFHNVSLLEDQAYILDQIVAIAKDCKPDVVLIAGDIYDRSVPPSQAVTLLDDVFNRICRDLAIPIIAIAGNHDGPERLAFGSRQLVGAGLYIIGSLASTSQPIVLEDRFGKVSFYGVPYAEPALVRHLHKVDVATHEQAIALLMSRIKAQHHSAHRSVVLSHLFLDGGDPSESERPLSVGGLDKVSPVHFNPFDYSALGHLHGPQHKTTKTIRYSGSILKYSFSEEKQNKSVTLVEMDKSGTCAIEPISLRPKRDLRIIEGSLTDLLEHANSDPARDDYLLVRLTDTHAILDIMPKLREMYPNVLHLERPGLMHSGELQTARRELLKKGELSMFGDFFQQISGEELTSQQRLVIEKALTEIHDDKDN